MARIAGVDIPKQKRGVIALTYIFGIGKSRAKKYLKKLVLTKTKKSQNGTMKKSDQFVMLLEQLPSKVNYVVKFN